MTRSTDPRKLVLAVLALIGSAAVLYNGIATVKEDVPAVVNDGARSASSPTIAGRGGDEPVVSASSRAPEGTSSSSPRTRITEPAERAPDPTERASSTPTPAGASAASAAGVAGVAGVAAIVAAADPSAGAVAGDERGAGHDTGTIDWGGMFERLLEREHERANPTHEVGLRSVAELMRDPVPPPAAEPEPPAPAPEPPPDPRPALREVSLRGLIAGPHGGVALVDGHVLRTGDSLPGTEFVVHAILRDRVLLGHPDLDQLAELMVVPMGEVDPVGKSADE